MSIVLGHFFEYLWFGTWTVTVDLFDLKTWKWQLIRSEGGEPTTLGHEATVITTQPPLQRTTRMVLTQIKIFFSVKLFCVQKFEFRESAIPGQFINFFSGFSFQLDRSIGSQRFSVFTDPSSDDGSPDFCHSCSFIFWRRKFRVSLISWGDSGVTLI